MTDRPIATFTRLAGTLGAFSAQVEISNQAIADLLICAFEGGTGYWCQFQIADYGDLPAGVDPDLKPFRHAWAALSEGGSIQCWDAEDPKHLLGELDRDAIARGLPLFLATRHGADFLADNADAETGDVFVQLCLFGKVVFG